MNDRLEGMACPIDDTQLVMSERQGIEIDYCPTCRGVWLDRGELDKIVDRSASDIHTPPAQLQGDFSRQEPHAYGHQKHRRRKSFLEELFD
jgi:hypothetical protein